MTRGRGGSHTAPETGPFTSPLLCHWIPLVGFPPPGALDFASFPLFGSKPLTVTIKIRLLGLWGLNSPTAAPALGLNDWDGREPSARMQVCLGIFVCVCVFYCFTFNWRIIALQNLVVFYWCSHPLWAVQAQTGFPSSEKQDLSCREASLRLSLGL